jgi:hypothetical protein
MPLRGTCRECDTMSEEEEEEERAGRQLFPPRLLARALPHDLHHVGLGFEP